MSSQCVLIALIALIADDAVIALELDIAVLAASIVNGRANAPNASIAQASSVTARKARNEREWGRNRSRIAISIINL